MLTAGDVCACQGPAGEEEEEEEPEPHVDPSEPVTSVALLMCAAAGADLALALDWARTMLDHLHTAPYHLPGALVLPPPAIAPLPLGPCA